MTSSPLKPDEIRLFSLDPIYVGHGTTMGLSVFVIWLPIPFWRSHTLGCRKWHLISSAMAKRYPCKIFVMAPSVYVKSFWNTPLDWCHCIGQAEKEKLAQIKQMADIANMAALQFLFATSYSVSRESLRWPPPEPR